jgi:hypothetical protein
MANNLMIRIFLLLLFFSPLTLRAQFTYFLEQGIPVHDLNNNPLSMPWAGGLNAAQYNTMDLDQDGIDDLVLFDRMANKVITFLNQGNVYVPAPEFESLFPDEVMSWLLLRDYNCDGKKDIFTGDNLGIKVFLNTTVAGENLSWQHFLFSSGSNSKSTVILTKGSTSKVNLQIQFDDMPSISDLDGDGDLDIINIQYAGSSIEFHQNLGMELYGTCDSLEFERVSRNWGNVRECHCGEFAFNGLSCPPHSGGRTKHAGGKSLLMLDVNGDQQKDLLLSEAECSQMFVLPNQGTTSDPTINSFSAFPADHPPNMIYASPYFEDLDFDGIKDLIVSPNIFSKEVPNTDLQRSNWFYKNTGSTASPEFSFVEPDFLQKHMIDAGDNSIPAFTDYDGDGDFDMFISKHAAENFSSAVYLYENTGKATSPSFKLTDEDYLGFSDVSLYNVKIQFTDINSDNTVDLVFTGTGVNNNVTNLYYLPNKDHSSLDFTGSSVQLIPFSLTLSENVYVTDVDDDGLPDILAGRRGGELEYWKNNGIKGAPSFQLEQEHFLGFASSILRQNITCATGDLDTDGKPDLVVGDHNGTLGIISDFRNVTSAEEAIAHNIIFNAELEIYTPKNLGGMVWPVLVNLFGSNRPAVVVGNTLGGLHFLRPDEGQSLPPNPVFDVYPNPLSKTDVLKIKSDRMGTARILSVLGQQLSEAVVIQANQIYEFTLPPLAAGLYLLQFTSNKKPHIERFVIK